MSVHIKCDSRTTSIWVDDQHLSRLTHSEVREIVLQILVFGGKALREEVQRWLNGDELHKIADFIAPESTATPVSKP